MPAYVEYAIGALNSGGYEAYAVGGCVRDSLLGAAPKDWDVTTSATPPDIARVFGGYKLLTHGAKYGTVAVIFDDAPIEITTYRTDGVYTDNRRPDTVSFTGSLQDDLGRRDFTINALAYSHGSGLIDYFGGVGDLAGKAVRCVGRPEERFGEDALRILRALRLAARLSFEIEASTSAAIHKLGGSLKNIAGERVCAELSGILTSGAGAAGILLDYYDVVRVLIPELRQGVGGASCPIRAIGRTPPVLSLRMALLFCAIENMGDGAGAARAAMRRLRFSNDVSDEIIDLLKYRNADILSGKAALKRLLGSIGEKRLRLLLQMRRALDAGSMEPGAINMAESWLDDIIRGGECYTLKGLDISGGDLIGIGFAQGKPLGDALSALLGLVVSGACPNERGALLRMARSMVPFCE